MDHRTIDEHNLIERYVLDRLDAEEQVRFEDHFADCARCLEAVELAQELRAGLAAAGPARGGGAADENAAGEADRAGVVPFRRPRPDARPALGPRLRWLAAAAVLALALLPSWWLAQRNRLLTAEVESLRRPWVATPAAVLEIRRDALPSDPAVPVLSAPAGDPWITVAVDLGDVAGLRLDARLYRGDGELLWSGEDLRLPDAGPLSLSFPTRLLPPGRYRLDAGLRSGERVEPAGSFLFEVRP